MKMVLLGAPGSGKDTLADQLQDNFQYVILSPGAIFRKEAELKTPLGLKARDEYWGKGNLCPDEMTFELIKSAFKRVASDKIVFNGFPRAFTQAEFITNELCHINVALDLVVNLDVAVKRLLARNREDDTEEVIKTRFDVYHTNNQPIVKYYKDINTYISVDADLSIDEMFESVKKILGEKL